MHRCARHLSGVPGGAVRSPLVVFDGAAKALHKARAARAADAASFDYLRDEAAARVVDRLCDVRRAFPDALDLYCGSGHVARALRAAGNKPGVARLACADVHADVLARLPRDEPVCGAHVVGEDVRVPIDDGTLDLVVSCGGLHWVNDLPGVLTRARQLLRPDGLFLGAMAGGETLRELRVSMQLAEEELRGGVSPHVSPMVHAPDAGNVLQRAGLRLTTVDLDHVVVPYRDMAALMRHLRGMGEGNAVLTRTPHYGRRMFARAAEIYEERFGYTDDQGRPCVPATFQFMHLIGWAPASKGVQPTPLARGAGTASFADLAQSATGADEGEGEGEGGKT